MCDGEPWFVAADVCKALEIVNPSDALSRLDPDEKMTLDSTDSHSGKRGGAQRYNVINEPGLYTLVLGSRKQEAKAFKRWVTHYVIPAIRKHGMYATDDLMNQILDDPDRFIQTMTALSEERKARRVLEKKIALDAPKVHFADCVATSRQSILVGDLAKLLRQNGVQIGQNRLFQQLRSDGFLCSAHGERWNMPTQRAMELGLFEIRERILQKPDGSTHLIRTTKVTGKGQIYFINRFAPIDAITPLALDEM